MNKKKWLFFLSGGALVLALVVYLGSNWVLQNDGRLRVGATYMTMNNSFYQVLNEEIKKDVTKRNGILETRDPALSVAKQCEQVEAFIQKKVDVIIINPVDGNNSRLIKALKQAHAAGIKIVVVDSQLKTSRFVDCTIMSDNYQAGVLCAKDLKSKKASAQILLLDHKGALSARDRIRGFTDTLKDDPNYKIVGTLDTQGQVEISMPQVEKFISQGTSFDTVMSLNDQSAIGMLAALEAKKVSHQVLVYSVDGSDNFRRIMATDPNASATAAQSPTKMGALAVTNSYALVANKKVPRKILIPVYLITQANMAQYESGWSL